MAQHPELVPSDLDIRQLASEIFVLGFPLLLMDAVRGAHPVTPRRFSSFAPRASELIPGLFLDDADCIHTTAVADLATGPVALHVPYSYGRYVSVTLIDAAGEAFASVGTQTMEHSNTDVVIAGPTWRGGAPQDVRGIRAPTDLVWAVSRIIAHSAADRPKARALAARQCLSALRDQGGSETTPCSGPSPELDQLDLSILRDLSTMDPRLVLHRLPQLIERTPAGVRRHLKDAGGKRLAQLAALPTENAAVQAAMRSGFLDGWRTIQEAQSVLRSVRSWSQLSAPTHELAPRSRAALALMRLGGPLRQDILTLDCGEDESGKPLNSGDDYRMRFAASELPPGSAGWRLTAHPAVQRSPGAVIGDHSPLNVAPDGSVEIQIQREGHRAGGGVNWLRPPEGAFQLTLRLYAPAPEALDGRWRVAPVERLGSRADLQSTKRRRITPPRRTAGPPPNFNPLFSAWRMSI